MTRTELDRIDPATGRRLTVFGTLINPNMGEGRYQDALRRFRDKIEKGAPFDAEDSCAVGDKYTSCSWGLCSCRNAADWPDANDHLFPEDFVQRGRISPRYRDRDRACPLGAATESQGCFYQCRVFQHRQPPSREEVLKLYDELIQKREQEHGRRVTADDGESAWKPSGSATENGDSTVRTKEASCPAR